MPVVNDAKDAARLAHAKRRREAAQRTEERAADFIATLSKGPIRFQTIGRER